MSVKHSTATLTVALSFFLSHISLSAVGNKHTGYSGVAQGRSLSWPRGGCARSLPLIYPGARVGSPCKPGMPGRISEKSVTAPGRGRSRQRRPSFTGETERTPGPRMEEGWLAKSPVRACVWRRGDRQVGHARQWPRSSSWWAGMGEKEKKKWAVGRKVRARPKLGFLFFLFSICHFFYILYLHFLNSNPNLALDFKLN
jgi:hypothetical protein